MFGFQKFIGGKPSSTAGMTDHLLKKTLQVAPVDERIALYYGRGQIRDDPAIALARDVAGGSKAFSEAPDEALSDYLKNGGDLDTRDRHCHVNLEMEWYSFVRTTDDNLCCSPSARLLSPYVKGSCAYRVVASGSQSVSSRTEVTVDESVSGEETPRD